MARRAALLTHYRRLRQTQRGLHTSLFKGLPKDVLEEGGTALGLLEGNRLGLGAEVEMAIFMDYCIYSVRRDGRNAVERFLAESPPVAGSEEAALLEAMRAARYSLFAVERALPGRGVELRDLLRRDSVSLVDLGLSRTASEGLVLASRVISPPGLAITTGASLPVDAATLQDVAERLEWRVGAKTVAGFGRLTPEEEADLAAIIIRSCLAAGASSQVTEVDVATG
jgi:hypothetical protein